MQVCVIVILKSSFDGFTSGKHVRETKTPIPQFDIAKLGHAGVYLFSLFLLQNIDCGYPQPMF